MAFRNSTVEDDGKMRGGEPMPYSGGALRTRPDYGEERLAALLSLLERAAGLNGDECPRRACLHMEAPRNGVFLPDGGEDDWPASCGPSED